MSLISSREIPKYLRVMDVEIWFKIKDNLIKYSSLCPLFSQINLEPDFFLVYLNPITLQTLLVFYCDFTKSNLCYHPFSFLNEQEPLWISTHLIVNQNCISEIRASRVSTISNYLQNAISRFSSEHGETLLEWLGTREN